MSKIQIEVLKDFRLGGREFQKNEHPVVLVDEATADAMVAAKIGRFVMPDPEPEPPSKVKDVTKQTIAKRSKKKRASRKVKKTDDDGSTQSPDMA